MSLLKSLFGRITQNSDDVLHCPRDKTALARQEVFDIPMYHCPECDGRWLPGLHAPKFFKRLPNPEQAMQDFQHQVDHHSQESKARCAKDGSPMRYFTQRGVTLDVCMQCRAIWFDGDELGQFMVSNPPGQPADAAAAPASDGKTLGATDVVAGAAVAVAAAELAGGLFDLFS